MNNLRFYSIHILPEPWHTLSLGNPIFYMVSAFRYGVLGVTDVNLSVAFAVILCCIVTLTSINLWLLAHGVGVKT
ncbi:hypothetical protein TI03_07040 [Achromatium sp. WMS1]|nr:hypothetical protein TI03_07040 [Achromatium sp. WMS1]